ncbi:MAG: hypothetical protein HQ567_23925 [Candidatus Nealsonbacteria bacterium]|nr:hypothetical protein [Candidatus Nealsonbacteria bacterium]
MDEAKRDLVSSRQFTLRTLLAAVTAAAVLLALSRFDGWRTTLGVSVVLGLAACGGLIGVLGAKFFGYCYAASSLLAIVFGLIVTVLPEPYHAIGLLATGGLAWYLIRTRCISYARRVQRLQGGQGVWMLLQVSAGLTWGGFGSHFLLVGIQTAGDGIPWPVMIPALALMPLAALLPIIPFWLFRFLRNRMRQGELQGKPRSDLDQSS